LTPCTGGGTAVRVQADIESVVTFDAAGQRLRLGLIPKPTDAKASVAHIERRRLERRDPSGRARTVVHFKVRYRDATGKHHSETKTRLVDAERRKAEIEVALATATWRDPRRGELTLAEWAEVWLPTRFDLRPTTWARLLPCPRAGRCVRRTSVGRSCRVTQTRHRPGTFSHPHNLHGRRVARPSDLGQ
jgi:hypothetical protein